ncbi:hypothetical protein ACTOVN_00520 [Arcanobacterium canis]
MILEAIVEILLDILSTALPEKWRRALRAASATDMRDAETRVRGGLAHAKFPSDLPTPHNRRISHAIIENRQEGTQRGTEFRAARFARSMVLRPTHRAS